MSETISVKDYLSLPTKAKATRRKPVQRESQLQQAAVRWFRYTYPQYKDLLYSIPNAGARTRNNANRMKCEGVVKGFPDLGIAVPRKGYHGMFIEMKYGNGKLSDEQIEILDALRLQGYWVEVCRSIDYFRECITTYLS